MALLKVRQTNAGKATAAKIRVRNASRGCYTAQEELGLDGLKYKVAGGEMTGNAGKWREWGAVQWLLA